MAVRPVWIDREDTIALQTQLVTIYGGSTGLRDERALLAAFAKARRMATFVGAVDVIDLAGATTFGIIQGRPFHEGNERAGFVAGVLLLELNGYRLIAPEDEAAEAILALSVGALDEVGYTLFLRRNAERLEG
jgi:death-on-curing protein